MTSRRAQRRARELEQWQPAEVAAVASGAALASMIPRAPGSTEPESERAARLADDAHRARMLAANWAAGDPARLGYGLRPWSKVTRITVPPDLRRDLVLGAGRPLECYEQAITYTLDHHDHDVALVHGLCLERGRWWPHAWAEIGGEIVYDPTPGEFYERESFYEVLQPVVVGVYAPEQAAAMAITEGDAGPWGAYQQGRPGHLLALQAVMALSDCYARTFPELFDWVQAMRKHDDRFADELASLVRGDALAVGDLLAALVERPELWRGHQPGAPWPYRLHKHDDHKNVIVPEVA